MPTAFSSLKFCIFRAPICRTSAYSATSGTSGATISVTTPRPVSAQLGEELQPLLFEPRKLYGSSRLERTSPASVAPDRATARAEAMIWAWDSPQGPAMTASACPPITASRTLMRVGSMRVSADHRVGHASVRTSSTPGAAERRTASAGEVVPMTPMRVSLWVSLTTTRPRPLRWSHHTRLEPVRLLGQDGDHVDTALAEDKSDGVITRADAVEQCRTDDDAVDMGELRLCRLANAESAITGVLASFRRLARLCRPS